MDKPLPLKIQEFQQKMSDVISNSELPIYILKYQIKDLLSEIETLERDYAQKEISAYNQSLQKEEKDKEQSKE